MNEILAIIVGLLVRLGLPVLITLVVVVLLHKLDARWQAESRQLAVYNQQSPCWEVKNCPPEKQAQCLAAHGEEPCWQVFRTADGTLKEECLSCDVFIEAPIPA